MKQWAANDIQRLGSSERLDAFPKGTLVMDVAMAVLCNQSTQPHFPVQPGIELTILRSHVKSSNLLDNL